MSHEPGSVVRGTGVPASAGLTAAPDDRQLALIVFGVLVVLIGCALGFAAPRMLLDAMRSARAPDSVDPRVLLPAFVMIGTLAVAFVWLGIGSILAKRWARALLLVLSGWWLAFGIVAVGFLALAMPRVATLVPPEAAPPPPPLMFAVIAASASLFLIFIPGLLLLFYGSRSVRTTFEARDPVRRWTDACPPAILTLSLAYGLSAVVPVVFLVFDALGRPSWSGASQLELPFFGVLLTGPAALGLALFNIALNGWCAWALLRLSTAGWWVALVSQLALLVSLCMTFVRTPRDQLIRSLGLEGPPPDPALVQVLGPVVIWTTVAVSVLCIGYMFLIRKQFHPRAPGPA